MTRSFVQSLRRQSLALSLFVLATAACSGSDSTGGEIPIVVDHTITTKILFALPGDNQSAGFSVNAAGHVAGQSANGITVRAFYWNGTGLVDLTPLGMQAVAYAISNGSTEYAVGYEQPAGGVRQAVRWTLIPAAATVLETSDSFAAGVNDAGTAAGRYTAQGGGIHGAIWAIGQSRIDIPPLTGYANTAAVDINNSGIVSGTSFGLTATTDKGWVRLTDGRIIELSLLAGASGSAAFAMSDVVDGKFYVAGHSITVGGTRTAARWTFNVAQGTSVGEAIPDMTVASGVTNDGAVSGLLTNSAASAALFFHNDKLTGLPSVGASGARGVAAASGFYYVSGDDFNAGFPFATRWTIPQ
jgi:hypothetical protein